MTLPVATDYDITIAPLGRAHRAFLDARAYAGLIVYVDTNTEEHCWPRLRPLLDGLDYHLISTPPGELNKHLGTCQQMWDGMFAAGAGRRWCTLNLGGGVLTDMGGFVASTFKRGMDFIQIPTTLLSQVDASVGGKLGIDYHEVKNSIGLFANPEAVWIDPAFLQTLPPRELRSGYAEVIKHALIESPAQWAELQRYGDLSEVNWSNLIGRSVAIKRDIVLEDPFERGRRKALNFGHTIGHAIESHLLTTDARMLHGEAIAAGMIAEAFLSTQLSTLSQTDLAEVTRFLIARYGHQPVPEAAFPRLLELMGQDKKNEDARINFTLLEAPGRSVVNATATASEIELALRYYNEAEVV